MDQSHQDSIRLLERYSIVNSHKSDELARTAMRNFRGNYEPTAVQNPVGLGGHRKTTSIFGEMHCREPGTSSDFFEGSR